MKHLNKTKGGISRIPEKQEAIITGLRNRIISGELPLGERLPPRLTLLRDLHTTPATLQAALNRLIVDGFITTKDRSGTFVSTTPPHLNNYGVAFCCDASVKHLTDGTFYSVLYHECLAMHEAGVRQFTFYFGLDGHADGGDYQRLISDIQSRRLAGLLVMIPTYFTDDYLPSSPVLAKSPLPRVLMEASHNGHPAISIRPYFRSLVSRGLGYFATRTRQRLAVIGGGGDPDLVSYIRSSVAARNLAMRPSWHMTFSTTDHLDSVRHTVSLMMESRISSPDCILVMDDVYTDYVLRGLYDAGMRPSEDVDVVSHCNFPSQRNRAFPVKWLGFSVRHFIANTIGLLDAQRCGEQPQSVTSIEALFEDEAAIP